MSSSLPAPGAVLLLIDLQQAIDHPSWGQRNNPQAEAQIARLLAHWRGQGWPVWHVRHDSTHPQSHYRPGQPGHAFKPEALPAAGEPVIGKQTNNAFIGTGLEQRLRDAGHDALVVAGVITNNSVEATVRMAGNLGFQTWLVADGVSPSGARTGTARHAARTRCMPCRWPTWTANTAWWSRPRRCSAALPERDSTLGLGGRRRRVGRRCRRPRRAAHCQWPC